MAARSFGRYEVVEPLESGGMAEVFRARDTVLDRIVAVKVLHSRLAHDPGFVERFRREAKLVASLRHPNIVQIYDFDIVESDLFMVMELLDGGSLKDRLQRLRERGEVMPLLETARILGQLAGALDYAHSLGAIHRDIKPGNVMFRGADDAIITDFGVAKMLGDVGGNTVVGTLIGSPSYMSPEQGAGKAVDARSDLYSLGVVLYHMASGRLPFESNSPTQIILGHLNQPTPPPREFNPSLPESVQRVILRSMAKDPAYRYASASEMADAFRSAVRGLDPTTAANDLSRGLRMALEKQAGLPPLAGPHSSPMPRGDRSSAPVEATTGSSAGFALESTVVDQSPALGGEATVLDVELTAPTDGRGAGRLEALRAAPTEIVRRPGRGSDTRSPAPSEPSHADTAPVGRVARESSVPRVWFILVTILVMIAIGAAVVTLR